MARFHPRAAFVLGALLTLALIIPAAASAHHTRVVPKFAQGHIWRQGVVPRRELHAASLSSSGGNLKYGGGVSDGTSTVGVTTGRPRVYLVFWGSQWGTQSTNSAGNYTYSGDAKGMAPDLQAFFKGIGTGGETWSGVMTQYCEGVSTGSVSCPSSSSQHVGYPSGGALAGVWEDTSAAAPAQATGHQLGVEAVHAAAHFGNTTQSSNRNTQYVIVSPSGTHPDGFNTLSGQFCAWHDYSGDSALPGGAVSWSGGWVAFTNMPYVTNAGTSCGENFVNSGSAGVLDGVTIVEGHEYAETITDQYPAGGWTDSSGNENGDKCAWISSGQGASQNITLTTGTFAVQSTWANDFNGGSGGCEVTHPILTNGPAVANPGNQTTAVGTAATNVQMTATEPNGTACSCSYSATGLPPGLSISSSGLISGTASTTAGTYTVTVTATDPSGATGSTSFRWSIVAGPAVSLAISPASATLGMGGTQVFKASGADQYGNAASVSGTTWSATGGGTVSPTTGSSTTFTATATPSATVTATLNGVTATANVTVNPAPANPIGNGGFESGTLSPWSWSGAYVAILQSISGCHAGSYCAQLGTSTPTNGNSTITQSFTVPSGTSTLTFYYKVVCTDTVSYDWATATLKDNTAATTSTVLGKTCTNNGAWVQVNHAVTVGHNYTLNLISHDDDYPGDPTYTLYDDVSVH